MSNIGLADHEIALLGTVFYHVAAIREVLLFGSRAKGNYSHVSDVDLALVGVGDPLVAEAVAEVLESLPIAYRFDVKAYDVIEYPPLLEHIHRVGVVIYRREEYEQHKMPKEDQIVLSLLKELGLSR